MQQFVVASQMKREWLIPAVGWMPARSRNQDADETELREAALAGDRWIPHSIFDRPLQRPARGLSALPHLTVQGAQPIER